MICLPSSVIESSSDDDLDENISFKNRSESEALELTINSNQANEKTNK
jgi:hypothetical protein